ncbi:MAG: 3-deoxy-D-manno-octulosonic acid transferase [Puniceicoccales bacterium]|jgi:3-deoxy-D-manno-octulosonic-acid transferase|nr:3-deoxy-D-manno-octulosonic acid transferase [Puniceicoccales bacterium]
MIWAYRLLFLPAFIFVLPYYLLRMLRRGGYARDFEHRFGSIGPFPAKRPGVRRIWIQAVSVGEINATTPLLRALAARDDTEIVLTTTTSTGYAIAREKLAPFTMATGVFPLDFWLFSHCAWDSIQPDLVVLMEGELWPEHLHQATKRKIPAILINARLSDRSFRRYAKVKSLGASLLAQLRHIGAATPEDASRFEKLGVPAEKITLTGNLKFDVGDNTDCSPQEKQALLKALGFITTDNSPPPPVLLGSSTWPGEEAMLLEVLSQARARQIPLKLLLVPRHAERRNEIAELLAKTSFEWFLRSQHNNAPHPADVCIADTTGELRYLTSVATLAFIGKSLPPNEGGQTPIDCAALGVPMVYGPAMTNFRDICKGLENAAAAQRVNDTDCAIQTLLNLLDDTEARTRLGDNARAWHTANRGATTRTLELIVPLLRAG